jgi:acyl carrier protein
MKPNPDSQALRDQLKVLLVETLRLKDVRPEDIDASEPLFAPDNRLGLDSLSALELLSAIEFKFHVVFANDGSAKQHFESISTLAAYIESAKG